MVLELVSKLLHCSHISKQNGLHHSLPNQLDFFCGELTAQKIIIVNVQQFDRLSCMEVFLDVLFAIHLANRRLCNNMITVVIAIMLNIVTQR
jgi:hypothetical protein